LIKTKNTDGLLDGLEKIDWPESTKIAQRNWIGKSEGAQFKMEIKNSDKFIEFYTTRLDTIFGCTFALVAPEHPISKVSNPKSQTVMKLKNISLKPRRNRNFKEFQKPKKKPVLNLKA